MRSHWAYLEELELKFGNYSRNHMLKFGCFCKSDLVLKSNYSVSMKISSISFLWGWRFFKISLIIHMSSWSNMNILEAYLLNYTCLWNSENMPPVWYSLYYHIDIYLWEYKWSSCLDSETMWTYRQFQN